MNKKEQIQTALAAIRKKLDYEELKYSDYMYGKESLTENVQEYVEEYKEIGRIAFEAKYKEFI